MEKMKSVQDIAGIDKSRAVWLALERVRRLLNCWHEMAQEIPPMCEGEKERRTYRIVDAAVVAAVMDEADKVREILDGAGKARISLNDAAREAAAAINGLKAKKVKS